VRYWDASVLVPLCTYELSTPRLRQLARAGPIVTWCLSYVEIASAIERCAREKQLTPAARTRALDNLARLAAAWVEVTAVAAVRTEASALLARHALRAADALQLGAARVASGSSPHGHSFVCADERLRAAAAREGFDTSAASAV
jgi:predicted nucleic acid-binding protein